MKNAMNEALHRRQSNQRTRTVVEVVDEQVVQNKRKLTPLGGRLLEARRAIERAGVPLLTQEQVERERAERRGDEARS